jgi:anaerobic selenocysteine-containing dehydrogenase
MPSLPDHWPINEDADEERPFKLATSPARNFLNSSFTETTTSRSREHRPEVFINPSDANRLGVSDGDVVQLGNERGRTRLHARMSEGVRPGVLVSEGVWPPSAFLDGWGINVLVGDDSVAPHGGVAFHDVRVWARPA